MRKLIVKLNNWVTRMRRVNVSGSNLLLLVPHCLQATACDRDVSGDIERCGRCGKCGVAGLLELRDRYNLLCVVVGGGRQALARVKQPDVKAVVAVACEAELTAGIFAAFPSPVVAVCNQRPHGPCRDTTVDLEQVERAVLSVLRSPE